MHVHAYCVVSFDRVAFILHLGSSAVNTVNSCDICHVLKMCFGY